VRRDRQGDTRVNPRELFEADAIVDGGQACPAKVPWLTTIRNVPAASRAMATEF
jgi:hypothetical protein